MKDFLGHDLQVGRFIIYPGLSGRSAIMQCGMIRLLRSATGLGKPKIGIYNDAGRKTNLMYPGRIVQEPPRRRPEGRRLAVVRLRPPGAASAAPGPEQCSGRIGAVGDRGALASEHSTGQVHAAIAREPPSHVD